MRCFIEYGDYISNTCCMWISVCIFFHLSFEWTFCAWVSAHNIWKIVNDRQLRSSSGKFCSESWAIVHLLHQIKKRFDSSTATNGGTYVTTLNDGIRKNESGKIICKFFDLQKEWKKIFSRDINRAFAMLWNRE